jgi:hypothetical protein
MLAAGVAAAAISPPPPFLFCFDFFCFSNSVPPFVLRLDTPIKLDGTNRFGRPFGLCAGWPAWSNQNVWPGRPTRRAAGSPRFLPRGAGTEALMRTPLARGNNKKERLFVCNGAPK